jgi:hypothetical protein
MARSNKGADSPPHPYNHTGPVEGCAPLPFRSIDRVEDHEPQAEGWRTLFARIPRPFGRPLVVRLDTDSRHVGYFFSLNWGKSGPDVGFDARMIVRRHPAAHYSIPEEYDSAILVSSDGRCAAITGTEYYTKVKTCLRMLCSTLCDADELYLHGCSLEFNGSGLLICGYSGVGKTTLVRALRDQPGSSMRIVNDDWGPLSLHDLTCTYTGERRLHMKYPTVAAIAPELEVRPASFPSEYFGGDASDPRARLMIQRERLFGTDGVCRAITVDQIWLLTRHDQDAPLCRPLGPGDAEVFEGGIRESATAIRFEYLNGAFLVPDAVNIKAQKMAHQRLLKSGKVRLINNHGKPDEVASRLLSEVLVAASYS